MILFSDWYLKPAEIKDNTGLISGARKGRTQADLRQAALVTLSQGCAHPCTKTDRAQRQTLPVPSLPGDQRFSQR